MEQKKVKKGTAPPRYDEAFKAGIDFSISHLYDRIPLFLTFFCLFLGEGLKIAIGLSKDQIADKSGKQTWTLRAIRYIITNERYTGNSIWQKYYMTDILPYRKVQNHGERESYYAQDTHKAILLSSG